MSSKSLDLDKLLSIEGIDSSIEKLEALHAIFNLDLTASDATLCDNAPILLHTAMAYKDEGNAHFQKASYIAAAISWSRGLRIEPSNDLLLLNRSLGYLKIGWYEAALRDAEAVIARCSVTESVVKACGRAAWAEYGLGLYEKALMRFELNDSALPSTQWIARCKQRIREQSSGIYEWATLFEEWQVKYKKDSLPVPRLDIADYIGPVEVRAIVERGGGRGVVATRDIKCGELLVMAKPFASVFPSEIGFVGKTCKDILMPRVVEKIIGRPECAALVMDLYAGEGFPPPPNIYPPTITDSPLAVPPRIDVNFALDIARINAIIAVNSFTDDPLREAEFEVKTAVNSPAVLHSLPSLFNHACFANAVRYSLGDVMVIRANQDISHGTELTVSYREGAGGNHLTRGKSLAHHMGHHICDCKFCQLDRADGDEAVRKREELVSDHVRIKEALIGSGLHLSSTIIENNYKDYIRAIESTYAPGRGSLRPTAFWLHIGLAQVIMQRAVHEHHAMLYEDARPHLFAALAAVGIVTKRVQTHDGTYLPIALNNLPSTGAHDFAIITVVQIAITYYCARDRSVAQEWVRAAHWMHAGSWGGDATFFNARFRNFLSEVNPEILEFFVATV